MKTLKSQIIEKYGSQGRFAVAAGYSEPFVSRVLTGRQTLTPDEMKRWDEILQNGAGVKTIVFNHRLKVRIVEKFGTQARFAQAAGTDEHTISRAVNGQTAIGEGKQLKWAALLDWDSAKLRELFRKPPQFR